MEFTVETQYTYEEYVRFNRTVVNVLHASRKKLIAACIIWAVGILVLIWAEEYQTALTAALAVGLFTVLMLRIVRRNIRKAWESNTVLQNSVNQYTFTEDGLRIVSALGDQHLTYDRIYRLIETPTNFYIMIANNQGYILNKADCTEEQGAFIRERCGKARERKK